MLEEIKRQVIELRNAADVLLKSGSYEKSKKAVNQNLNRTRILVQKLETYIWFQKPGIPYKCKKKIRDDKPNFDNSRLFNEGL